MARTQAERRGETRQRLLEAAAEVFAERGIDGASVDAVAEAAGRTSGALYAHFGSKEGLLLELLDEWKGQVTAVATAEVIAGRDMEERLHTIWRNVADHALWLRLEHELWRWVTSKGDDATRQRLAGRYRDAWAAVEWAVEEWAAEGLIDPPVDASALPALLTGLLIGMEMQHRVDPDAATEEAAVEGMRALLGIDRSDRSDGRKQ